MTVPRAGLLISRPARRICQQHLIRFWLILHLRVSSIPTGSGWSAFLLAAQPLSPLQGVRFDGAAQDTNCTTGPDAADCVFFRLGGVRFADHPGFEQDARNPRISHAVIIDPGFGGAVKPESLQTALPGLTLINLGEADRLDAADVGPDGHDLVNRLPGAIYVEIAPANHFTFLATCKPGAAQMLKDYGDDPICTDPEGTDRATIHKRLVEAIATGLGL